MTRQPRPHVDVTATRRCRDECGSVAIEAVVGLPAFALFIALIVMGAGSRSPAKPSRQRPSTAHGQHPWNAPDPTRPRQPAPASPPVSPACRAGSSSVVVDAAGYDAPLGTTVLVGVTVRCRVGLADLSLPGVPGHRLITETAFSPVDAYRERR